MAVTASGLFVTTWIDILDNTQLAIDLSLATHKLALFNNSITPNFSTDTAYGVAPYNANEVTTTTFWPSGGVALSAISAGATSAAPTLTESPTGTIKYDMNDVSVASTTLTNAQCALLYADALAGNNAILLVNFVTAASTSNGTFGITWAAGGVTTLDITP